MIDELKIDLASGNNKREGFFGIDIATCKGVDCVMDLSKYPWDIKSNSVEEINCSHYIEHIPHDIKNPNDSRDGLIQFMNELYRIMKVGGKATITAPYYTSIRAFGDPTHVRYIGEWSFLYFNQEWLKANNLEHYGIEANFDIKYSYYITNELTLKSEEVRNKAFKNDWNAIDDIIVEMIKIN
jgi:predicted SAM-dependent methyltransferase